MGTIITISAIALFTILAWALFGGKEGSLISEGSDDEEKKKKNRVDDEEAPERIFRRRASDKEIEESYPLDEEMPTEDRRAQGTQSRGRRKSDPKKSIPEQTPTQLPFQLPYSADEIIPDTSRFRVYKRTLMNAEIYARKGDYTTAISLFEGVSSRISDAKTRLKIETNIDYLNRHKEKELEETIKKIEGSEYDHEMQTNEVKFKIDSEMPNTINIGIVDPAKQQVIDPDKIAEQVIKEIRDELKLNDKSNDVNELIKDINKLKTRTKSLNSDLSNYDDEALFLKNLLKNKREINPVLSYIDELKVRSTKLSRDIDDIKLDAEGLKDSTPDVLDQKLPELHDNVDILTEKKDKIEVWKERARKELDRLRDQKDREVITDIRKEIQNLSAQKETVDFDKQSETIEDLKEQLQSLSTLQDDVNNLSELQDQLKELTENMKEFAETNTIPMGKDAVTVETDEKPVVIDSQDDKPIPVSIDPEPILEILDKLSQISGAPVKPSKVDDIYDNLVEEKPAAKSPEELKEELKEELREELKDEFKKEEPEEIPLEKLADKEESLHKKESSEEVEEDDFELLKDFDKAPESELTDEDIFEKILKNEKDKTESDFEIIGDKKESPGEFEYSDTEKERQIREEENFYKKLLNKDTKKKRELPILRVTYDFSKLPDDLSLSREKNILEYSFYKYKPMFERAQELIKTRKVRDAINYYKVVMAQNIPPEFKAMIRKNINDLTEYLEKYLTAD